MEKKKWIIVILCIVICIMVVGYAAFSTQLKINGTASIESNWSIKFTKIEEVSKTKGATITNPPTASGTTAIFNVDLTTPGDKVVYNITIANEGTLNAIIEKVDMSDTGSDAIYFKVTGITKGDLLNKGEAKIITIEIGYDSSVTTQPTKPLNNLSIEVKCVQNVGQTIVPPVTNYQIGDEVRLAGSTAIISWSNANSEVVSSYLNYTKWNVIKQTDDTVTLLSRNVRTSDSAKKNYDFLNNSDFVEDNPMTMSAVYVNSSACDGGEDSPTLNDLSEIITVNLSDFTYTLRKAEYSSWLLDGYYYNVYPMGINIDYANAPLEIQHYLESGGNLFFREYTLTPEEDAHYSCADRPMITLAKSDIPDQSAFR